MHTRHIAKPTDCDKMIAPLGASILLSGANSIHNNTMNKVENILPRKPGTIKLTDSNRARFWSKVDQSGGSNSCWLWIAAKDGNGYGQFGIGRKLFKAHRVAWTFTNGSIENDGSYHGACVCHRCDNPSCVNPSHLFLGKQSENVQDMLNKGRHGSKSRPEMMARGSLHGHSKLTEHSVISIRMRYARGGVSFSQLGNIFGVSVSAISKVINRKLWTHI